jgi:branched-subunit amino acid aminotransferase/4-amino-4-deoxychorismate lyase
MPSVWINGDISDEAAAALSIRDTGVLHAAGVFTTMRAYQGTVFRLDHHLNRLRDSCQALSIPLIYANEHLNSAVRELLQANNLINARLRLTVTGGTASDDPVHGLRLHPNCFLTAAEVQEYPRELYEQGMTVGLLDEQKLNPFDIQAGHKTLNYFSRMAALRWARQAGAGEALWFNIHNYLQSGSISNVFIMKAGRLITPPTQAEINAHVNLQEKLPYARSNVLPGVTRNAILQLAQTIELPVDLSSIHVEQLLDADEIFLTNSIMNIMPVTHVERSPVGNAQPGPFTMQVSDALRELQNKECSAGN